VYSLVIHSRRLAEIFFCGFGIFVYLCHMRDFYSLVAAAIARHPLNWGEKGVEERRLSFLLLHGALLVTPARRRTSRMSVGFVELLHVNCSTCFYKVCLGNNYYLISFS